MALQLFKTEKKIDTIPSDNIQEIFKLIHTPSVPLLELFLMGCGKLHQCIVQYSSPVVLTRIPEGLWKVETACFMFDPGMEMLRPAIGAKKKKRPFTR